MAQESIDPRGGAESPVVEKTMDSTIADQAAGHRRSANKSANKGIDLSTTAPLGAAAPACQRRCLTGEQPASTRFFCSFAR
ncbi:MAG: hypothetical protein LBM75_11670 [Myxococcales bacterium]|nr:hypothetical protein [Myxococcales bacterium]